MDSAERFLWQDRAVIVTGASGFIGAALAKRLAAAGAQTHAFVRGDAWRLAGASGTLVVHFVDITDQTAVKDLYAGIRPTVTFNAAAYGVNHSSQDVLQGARVNVVGGLDLLVAAAEIPGHRFINLGTRYESGTPKGSIREEYPQDPRGVYGTTKYAAQIIMEDFSRRAEMILRTATLFGVYGPMEGEHKFIPYVINSLLHGQAPRVTGCQQVRNYTYIDDAVHGMLLLAELNDISVMRMNIGSPHSYSLQQIVECIAAIVQAGVKIEFGTVPYRQDEIWHLVPNLDFGRKVLGWTPTISLENGLRKTVDWYRSRINSKEFGICSHER